ncbi:MAG: EAL domain-containing protein [Aquitalea sp.]|nr:EAL domain-containing protein [Aquitalea sp.]
MSLMPMKLMILEDQVILRKLISRQTGFFSRHPTQIDEFSDPAEALRSAAEASYDLIITDIGMPGMSGIDFIKNLSAIGCQASLLIISGYDKRTLHTIADMARRQGIRSVHFLCKPYSIDQFLLRLNEVFCDIEQKVNPRALDLQQLWQDCISQPLELAFQPVFSAPGRQLCGMQLVAMQLPEGPLSLDAELYRQLARNPQLPALILETVMERLAELLSELPLALRQNCRFSLYLDATCLAQDNLFDRYYNTVRQNQLSADQIGFLLADGLDASCSPVCYENIAKLKYFGFPLLADQLGEGGLTVSNLLKLPLDGLRLSVNTWRKLNMQPADIAALLQCAGLTSQQLTLAGVDTEEDLGLLADLTSHAVCGNHISGQVRSSELLSYLQQQTGVEID